MTREKKRKTAPKKKKEETVELETKDPGGRPTTYTDELADKIIELMEQRDPDTNCPYAVSKIGKMDGLPCEATIYNWVSKHAKFLEKYTRARETQAHMMAENVVQVPYENGIDPQIAKLKMDGLRWYAGKMNGKYNEKKEIDLNHGAQDSLATLLQDLDGKTPRIPIPIDDTGSES